MGNSVLQTKVSAKDAKLVATGDSNDVRTETHNAGQKGRKLGTVPQNCTDFAAKCGDN